MRYTLVNLIGLSAAFAGAMLIGLYLFNQLSYERWLPNADRIAMIQSEMTFAGNKARLAPESTQYLLAPEIDGRIAGVEQVARVWDQQVDTVIDGRVDYQNYLSVDPAFLQMVSFPVVEGDPVRAIAQPRTLVVTQGYAEKWFGARQGVLGKTLRLRLKGELVPFTIEAVIKDKEGPTHFELDAFYKLDRDDYEFQDWFESWGSLFLRTYVKLAPDSDLALVKQALDQTFEQGKRREFGGDTENSFAVSYHVVPLLHLHLNPPEPGISLISGERTFLLGLTAAGLVFLTLAVANFAALSSAMAARRARESALRRTLGASKLAVALQFLGENIGFAVAALCLGLLLLPLALPAFNAFLNLDLTLEPFARPAGIAILAGLAVVTGSIAGLAPALTIARMDPARVLTGGGAGARQSGARLRAMVVASQYAVSAALIAGALISHAQVQHMTTSETNFDPEGMVLLYDAVRPEATRLDTLLQRLRATSGVVAVTTSASSPGIRNITTTNLVKPGGGEITLERQTVGDDYLETYRTPLLAGRWLDPARTEDNSASPDGAGLVKEQNVVLNAAALRELELESPEAALGKVFRQGSNTIRVIGVAADQAFGALYAQPTGVYYVLNRRDAEIVAVRFSGVDQETAIVRARAAWRSVYPDLPVEVEPVDTVLWELYAKERRQTYALIGFSGLAVLLAALGAYALSAFSAERRGREMAIRRIVGADGWSIAALHLRRALVPAAFGAGLATPLAIAGAERWLSVFENRIDGSLAYGLAAASAVLALAVIAASAEAAALARTPPGKTLQAV